METCKKVWRESKMSTRGDTHTVHCSQIVHTSLVEKKHAEAKLELVRLDRAVKT